MAASLEDCFGEVASRLAPRAFLVGEGKHAPILRVAVRLGALETKDSDRLREAALIHAGEWDEVRGTVEFELEPEALHGPLFDRWPAIRVAVENTLRPRLEPRIMGVINVTPDSFSDGGLCLDPGRARDRALQMVSEGASLLDFGGESTRPGAEPVPAEEELRRVIPVIEVLARETDVPLSIDTMKSPVAERALDAGASMVNDVSAGRFDPDLIPLVARRGCGYLLMHMQGTPAEMQRNPRYTDVVAEVTEFLRERAAACWRAGIDPARLVIDPGIGFGKRLEHNLELLRRLRELRSLGLPLCVGVSRKSFIQHVNERAGAESRGPQDRIGGTAAAVAISVHNGADILRVHDVKTMAEAARVAWALVR